MSAESRLFFAAFRDELQKEAGPSITKNVAGQQGVHVPLKSLAHLAGGAALLYGGKRLVDDVKMAEEHRRMQRQQERGY